MADDNYESTLIFDGDTKGAEKAFDRIHKGLKQTEDDNRRVAKEAQKASLLYADSMVEAARRVEAENKRLEASLKRLIDGYKQARAESARSSGSTGGGGSGAALRSGAMDIAREIGGGSPFAPLLEGAAEFTRGAVIAGGAAAAAGLAWQKLQEAIEASRQAAEDRAKQVLSNAEIETEATRLLRDNQYTAAKALADSQLAEQSRLQTDIQRLQGLRDAAQAEHDAVQDLGRKLLARNDIDEYTRQIEAKQTEFSTASERAITAYTALNSELGQSAKVAEDYNKAVETFVEKDKERKAAEDALLVTMAALEAQEKALNEAYTKGVIARSAARGRSDARANEDRDLAAERAAEDLAEALEAQEKAHQANLESIVQRGQDAIADVYAAIAERQMQAAKQVADLQRQYNEEQLRAEQTFGIERGRALEDYQREVARAAEDLRDQLRSLREERDRAKTSAILDNNVLAFLEAQQNFEDSRRGTKRDFRKDSRRGAEDFGRDEQRAAEDFARENEERRKAHEQRLSEIQAELAEFIASSHQKIAQIEAQTQQELALAQATYEEQLRIDQEQRDKINRRADEDLQRSLDRLRQDREAEDNAARTAHTEALGRIEEQRTAQESALNVLIAKVEELRQKALALSFGGAGTPGTTPLPSTAPYVPSPGSEKFYEDPKQGAAGGGGGGFGAGLSGASSVGGGLTVNVQPRVMSMGGVEYVPREDFEALIETIKAAWREKEVNLS